MSFIYYVLILMLSYTGPVYAGLQVEKEYEIVEEDVGPDAVPFSEKEVERYAQAEVEVGELSSGKIKVFTDKTHSTTIVVDKQDCSIMRKKDDTLALGWKFGGLMWGFGPEIKIGHTSGVAWKADVQRMVAEYQELCTQFNTGRLSQQEYQTEKQEIVQRGYNYARELEKRFKQKKDAMFREMDRGKYIHLQKMRFFEGCCYYHNRPERNLVVEAPHEVVPVHSGGHLLDNESERWNHYVKTLKRRDRISRYYDSRIYDRNHRRYNRYSNHRQHNHKRHNNRYYNNRHSNHRQQNNKDLNWDVYGNSNGQWSILMEKEW